MKRIVTIEEACELVTDGTHYTPKNAGTGVPFLTVKDVTDDALDLTNCSFITEHDFEAAKAGNSVPYKGDVLFSKDGTVGKVHVVTANEPFAVLSSIAILRPKSREVESSYLGHALRSPCVLDDALKKKTGSAIRRIILGDLKKVRLPLPPMAEQRRIAEVLDRAEALRAKRRAALAELDALTQSLFLDLFGDPVTNPMQWPMRSFDETMRDETARSGKMPQSEFLSAGRYPVIDQGQSDVAGYCDDDTMLCVSALPVIVFGDHTRAVKLISYPFVVGADGAKVLAVQPGMDAVFLATLLRMLPIPNLGYSRHMREVKRLQYIVPPLALQQEFARRVAAVEKLKQAQRTALAEQDALFATLQHRAFRGEL